MLRKPAHFIFYLSTLWKPAAGGSFCNVLKYKADTFYLSTIQKPAPEATHTDFQIAKSCVDRGDSLLVHYVSTLDELIADREILLRSIQIQKFNFAQDHHSKAIVFFGMPTNSEHDTNIPMLPRLIVSILYGITMHRSTHCSTYTSIALYILN